jgi:hypothetical protein
VIKEVCMGFAIVIRADKTKAELLPFNGSWESLNGEIGADYTNIIGKGSMRGVEWMMIADEFAAFKQGATNEWATLLRMFSKCGGDDVKGDVVLLAKGDGYAARAMNEDEARELWGMFSARSGSFGSQLVATA